MARINTEELLKQWGAVNIACPQTRYKNKALGFILNLIGVMLYVIRLRKGDIVVLQYPVKKYYRFLCRIARLRKASTITLIHDLGSMKRRRITEEKELRRLLSTDYIIATNGTMLTWCRQKGLVNAYDALELWDYPSVSPLHNNDPVHSEQQTNSVPVVVYAARLDTRRNSFLSLLEQTDLSYQLHMYGRNIGTSYGENNPNITTYELLPSEVFISKVKGDYGLVWYGHSLDSLNGPWGEYVKICTPMKISFYLRTGMPCIIHRDAALAPLVEREGIGLVLDSLNTLGQRIVAVSSDERKAMMQNVRRMQERVNEGYYLRQVMERALQHFTNR